MKITTRTRKICTWILLILVIIEFVFIAYAWLSYCPPAEAIKFVLSGAWFKEEFDIINAGCALDQPTIGKFFLWTSLMSYLSCTIILLMCTVVAHNHHLARQCVNIITTLLIAFVLIELLAPTFILVHYVLFMGITIRRFLGFCLCFGFWISLPSIVFWLRKADLSQMKWISSPLTWALACSLIAPACYSSGILLGILLHPSAWCDWATEDTLFLLAWFVLFAPLPCAMWLRKQCGSDNAEPSASGNGVTAAPEP